MKLSSILLTTSLFISSFLYCQYHVEEVADIHTEENEASAGVDRLIGKIGNTLIFNGESASVENGLWAISDKNSEPVLLDNNFLQGYNEKPVVYQGYLYFKGYRSWDVGLWRTDGTPEGTSLVNYNNGDRIKVPTHLTVFNNVLYFDSYGKKYSLIGGKDYTVKEETELQMDPINSNWTPSDNSLENSAFISFKGYLYGASNGVNRWKPGLAEPERIPFSKKQALRSYNTGKSVIEYNGRLFFNSASQLIATDANSDSLIQIIDTYDAYEWRRPPSVTGNYHKMVVSNGLLYFYSGSALQGWRLLVTDGTPEGTGPIHNFVPDHYYNEYLDIIPFKNGVIYAVTNQDKHNLEIWKWDLNGTQEKLTELYYDHGYEIPHFTEVDGKVLFFNIDQFGRENIWATDGTKEGTHPITQFNLSTSWINNYGGLFPWNNELAFIGNDGYVGAELWVTNGAPEETSIVRNHLEEQGRSFPESFFEWKDKLFFTANSGLAGREVWYTDGVATKSLCDCADQDDHINAFDKYVFLEDNRLFKPVILNDHMYYLAKTDNQGGEILWKSDGTPSGTAPFFLDGMPDFLVNADLLASSTHLFFIKEKGIWSVDLSGRIDELLPQGVPDNLRLADVYENKLVFYADMPDTGYEPWITDGTSAGTHIIKDIVPGGKGSAYYSSTQLKSLRKGTLFFANHGILSNAKLWSTDGTAEGTQELAVLGDTNESYYNVDIQSIYENNGAAVVFTYIEDQGSTCLFTDGSKQGTKVLYHSSVDPYSHSSQPTYVTKGDWMFFEVYNKEVGHYSIAKVNTQSGAIAYFTPEQRISFRHLFRVGDDVLVSSYASFNPITDGSFYKISDQGTFEEVFPALPITYHNSMYSFKGDAYFRAAEHGNYDFELWRMSKGTSSVLEEQKPTNQLVIVPNPANHKIHAKIPVGNWSYSIYALDGKTMQQGETILGNFDISGLKSGMYMLRLENEQSQLSGKFIKQ